jgi:redox-sensitive bicupin YhaK (pirin superfamily)
LLKGGKNKGTQRVRVGEEIDGWTVTSIEKDKLVLRNGTETESLQLWNYKPVKPVQQAPKKAVKRPARPPRKKPNGQTARQRPGQAGKP